MISKQATLISCNLYFYKSFSYLRERIVLTYFLIYYMNTRRFRRCISFITSTETSAFSITLAPYFKHVRYSCIYLDDA